MAVKGPESEENAWKGIFESVIKRSGDTNSFHFDLCVHGETVVVVSKDNKVSSLLETLFRNPAVLCQQMNYTLQEVVYKQQGDKEPSYLPVHTASNVPTTFRSDDFTAKDVLSRLFHPHLLTLCQLDLSRINQFDDAKTKTLRFPINAAVGFRNIWQGYLEIMTMAMIRAGIVGMRKAIERKEAVLNVDLHAKALMPLSDAFSEVIGIEDTPQCTFYFNYGLLLRLLFPITPSMVITTSSKESRFEARFQKKELLAYFSHIFTEGFVLNYNLRSASAVCLPPATHLVREQLINCVVLDTSDSMKQVFKQYLEEVKKLLSDMLSMSKVGDEILIVDFDSETRSKAFKVTGSKQKDEAAIFAHLDSLVCSGGTRLYPTMLESLQSLLANYPGRLQSLMIITDGDGNYGNDKEPALNAHFEEFKVRPAATIPTLFTVGIGPHYKRELFVNWANRVGGQFTHIESIEQIHQLLSNHVKTMCRSRALLRFVHGCALKILPVYHGCPVLLPDVAIKPSETFVVNDRAYTYTSGPRDALSAEAILASLGQRRNTFSPLFSAQTDYSNSEDEDEDEALTAESQQTPVVDETDFVEQMLSNVKCTIS